VKTLSAILAPPLVCVGILGGIAWEKSTHVQPQNVATYHAAIKALVDEKKQKEYMVGGGGSGLWFGKDQEPTKAAVKLLRPNVIFSRRYTESPDKDRGANRMCDVLIVQCPDARDMVGHYPENCYPNGGETLVDKRPRDWQIGETKITGTEYTFERFSSRGQPVRRCVYSFLVVPGVVPEGAPAVPGVPGATIVRDIKGVNKAAEDYQRRHFGAAQFQFVFQAADPDLPRDTRDQIFMTLMGANMDVLQALNNVNIAAAAQPAVAP
jgi:hypothetical protein